MGLSTGEAIQLLRDLVECPDLNSWERKNLPTMLVNCERSDWDEVTPKMAQIILRAARDHLQGEAGREAGEKLLDADTCNVVKTADGCCIWSKIHNKYIGKPVTERIALGILPWLDGVLKRNELSMPSSTKPETEEPREREAPF